ncbi:MAG TPA: prepilin peptidase [Tepidisphaeraceae bacterium]|jgi:leader peptidase (prepilin peptidase)/N-methyltransferase|nr:prepilin peptidase [Tepidisphaeraceae bacterium]
MPHIVYILFLFAFGASVGSFLNVVVWRLPQIKPIEGEGLFRGFIRSIQVLSEPPSHCPKCNRRLKWYDNLPVFGWLKLRGKCRFCRQPISMRYPIIEAIAGLIFVGYYAAFFIYQTGPCVHDAVTGQDSRPLLYIANQWWLYGLYMMLLSGLLAASLIDAEMFIIPMEIPWTITIAGVVAHSIFDSPYGVGNLIVGPVAAAVALGGAAGLAASILFLWKGFLGRSFAEGAPLLEIERDAHDRLKKESKKQTGKSKSKSGKPASMPVNSDEPREWSRSEVRREMRHEMRFLLLPMFGAIACGSAAWKFHPAAQAWAAFVALPHVGGFFGAVYGGLIGGMVVWLTRIFGTLVFGREAMGMGDVDLMVCVGAVLGAFASTVAFFLAPFLGIGVAIYMFATGSKRELPYGPYLSLAAALVMLFYCPIVAALAPGLDNMAWLLRQVVAGGN